MTVRLFRDCGDGIRILAFATTKWLVLFYAFPYLEFEWIDWRRWGGDHVQVAVAGIAARWSRRKPGQVWSDGVPIE